MCRWGSPARLVRCRKAAATNPAPRSRRVPNCGAVTRRRGPVVGASPDVAGFAFEPGDGLVDGPVDGAEHVGHDERVTEGVEDRHRLGDGERQVESGHSTLPRAGRTAVGGLPGFGLQAGHHRPQLVGIDGRLDAQGEPRRRRADPAAGQLTVTRVVVLEAAGDARQVVVLAADAQLPDRHHPPADRPATGSRRPRSSRDRNPWRCACSTLVHRCGSRSCQGRRLAWWTVGGPGS